MCDTKSDNTKVSVTQMSKIKVSVMQITQLNWTVTHSGTAHLCVHHNHIITFTVHPNNHIITCTVCSWLYCLVTLTQQEVVRIGVAPFKCIRIQTRNFTFQTLQFLSSTSFQWIPEFAELIQNGRLYTIFLSFEDSDSSPCSMDIVYSQNMKFYMLIWNPMPIQAIQRADKCNKCI